MGVATAAMVLIALLWIPVIQGAHGLYDYLQAVQGYLAPPIFVVFFFGVFWKRLNAAGALAAMLVGFLLGIFRMLVDTPVTAAVKLTVKETCKPEPAARTVLPTVVIDATVGPRRLMV